MGLAARPATAKFTESFHHTLASLYLSRLTKQQLPNLANDLTTHHFKVIVNRAHLARGAVIIESVRVLVSFLTIICELKCVDTAFERIG